eukprot:497029-Prymnesium_polylepis.1
MTITVSSLGTCPRSALRPSGGSAICSTPSTTAVNITSRAPTTAAHAARTSISNAPRRRLLPVASQPL